MTFVLIGLVSLPAGAQSFNIVNSFTGGLAGLGPQVGLTMDRAGNFYGTTVRGGYLGGNCQRELGCGLVYKLTAHGSGWTLSPLYAFRADSDGNMPVSRVVFGPDGALYGTTQTGGGTGCGGNGCGTIYRLTPPATICHSFSCLWTETVIHRFNGADGSLPSGDLTFDQAGNLYGTTAEGGTEHQGTVFQLARSSGGWTLNTLLNCSFGTGLAPESGVILDHSGNLYGAASGGGSGFGVIFQLSPSASGWTNTTLYTFHDGGDGAEPSGGLIFDAAGNLYGTTFTGGNDGRGTVFRLSPSNGGWSILVLHSFTGGLGGGTSYASLTFDPSGNLYGVTTVAGLNGAGNVFELSNGDWTYTDLYDFPTGGGNPYGTMVWNNGTLYGTTLYGGTDGLGTVFAITP